MEKRDIILGESVILSIFMFVQFSMYFNQCISVCGVKLRNRLSLVLKQCPSVTQFKKQYKRMVFRMYMEEERIWLGVHTDYLVIVFI